MKAPAIAASLLASVWIADLGATDLLTPSAERCSGLIAQFDEIIVNRFDRRILMLDRRELEEARTWRHQAETDCAAGAYAFGIDAIMAALRRIGVVPPGEDEVEAGE